MHLISCLNILIMAIAIGHFCDIQYSLSDICWSAIDNCLSVNVSLLTTVIVSVSLRILLHASFGIRKSGHSL